MATSVARSQYSGSLRGELERVANGDPSLLIRGRRELGAGERVGHATREQRALEIVLDDLTFFDRPLAVLGDDRETDDDVAALLRAQLLHHPAVALGDLGRDGPDGRLDALLVERVGIARGVAPPIGIDRESRHLDAAARSGEGIP